MLFIICMFETKYAYMYHIYKYANIIYMAVSEAISVIEMKSR